MLSRLWVGQFLHVLIPDVKVHMGSRLGGTVVVDVLFCMRWRVHYGGLAVSVFVGSVVSVS
jgi:hypothetical protein